MIYYWNLKTCRSLWPAEFESCRSHMKSYRTVTDDRRFCHALPAHFSQNSLSHTHFQMQMDFSTLLKVGKTRHICDDLSITEIFIGFWLSLEVWNTVDSLYLEHPLSRTSLYLELKSQSLSVSYKLFFSFYLELSLSRTNFLVPCEFEIERVNCTYKNHIVCIFRFLVISLWLGVVPPPDAINR